MPVRYRNLINDSVQTNDSDTFSLNLPRDGALHALLIRVQATNGSTSGRNLHPSELADVIRVVGNGDERFIDLTGDELMKWNEIYLGKACPMVVDERASVAQWIEFVVPFGRDIVDMNMYLPLRRIETPRLEIPYAQTPAADGGIATGTMQFNVAALWTPESELSQYQGTLTLRTIKSFTTVASGDEETDVTIRNPIRAIGIYCYEPAIDDITDISRIRLVANAGEFDLFNADIQDFVAFNESMFGGDVEYDWFVFAQDNDTLDTRLGRPKSWSLAINAASDQAADTFLITNIDIVTGDRLTFDMSIGDITAGAETFVTHATDTNMRLNVRGHFPSYFGLIPFMYVDDEQGYLRPTAYSDLRIILTNGGAGGDARISVQELKRL